MLRRLIAVLAFACLPFAAAAQTAPPFNPGSVYICPNDSSSGLDCYLDAVVHLYTMCRHVKSIEVIEFGLPGAQEGVNGAKSEYCVDKQKINITRPYQAALREATPWHDAVDQLRELQAYWVDAMTKLKWQSSEAPQDYEDRLLKVYDELSFKIDSVRVAFTTAQDAAGAAKAPVATKKAPPAAKAKKTAAAPAN